MTVICVNVYVAATSTHSPFVNSKEQHRNVGNRFAVALQTAELYFCTPK